MHDPNFGLGMDTRVHLWHPCEAKAEACNHNGVDWVDLGFMRQLTLREGAWSTEQVEVQVRREVARDLMLCLLGLFVPHAGTREILSKMLLAHCAEEPCQDATVEE